MSGPRLYDELADWWHLMSAPDEYRDEARTYRAAFEESARGTLRTMLELGSGGGNNASHLKDRFTLTLIDPSGRMLSQSHRLNPECEHVAGDMRTVRLGRTFDAVFVHDAIMYLATEEDLRAALETASAHCRPGGVALFAPDCVRETWRGGVESGGHDGAGRSLRYLQWTFDPDPSDTEYVAVFAFLLREGQGPVRYEHDVHRMGIFDRAVWLRLLDEVGFDATARTLETGQELFTCRRRA